jgi:PAS domain S-box-containing protein
LSGRSDLYREVSIALLILTGLYFISIYNYVLFHSLAELFSIVIAAALFLIAWNIRRILENQYLLFISIAYLFVGIIDAIHTFVYPGMRIVGGLDTNPPTQLWIAARYMESLSLLFAPLCLRKRLRAGWTFFSYAVITLIIFSTIFYFHNFPDCYIQGKGLTPFKIISEVVISGILLGALLFLVIRREAFDANVLKLLIVSILATIASELSFTLYVNVYELSNLIGHYLKILAFYLIYKAIIQTGLTRPFSLLFRNLHASEERYRSLVQLAPDAIFVNRNNKIDFVNPAALQLFGATAAEQILGKSPFDLFHSDYHSIMQDRIQKMLNGQPAELIEEKIIRMDGTVRDVEVAASPFHDQEGTAIQVILRDVTERKRAEEKLRLSEEALQHANEYLEQRVRERTMDLQNLTEQLERSRHELRNLASELVMAEERERKRIAGVLHDEIAQILATAQMRLSLFQGIPSDQKDKQTLEETKALLAQSIQETRTLMNDLGNPLLFDLGLKPACEALADRLMERHPVRISCDIRDAFKNLNPDVKTIVYQVVRELLNNVMKHGHAQNAHVMIDMENRQFRVKVTDDGVGFDPQALGPPTVEGGFGLYSIRERLIAIDGNLRIESAPGTGTVVTANFPAELG